MRVVSAVGCGAPVPCLFLHRCERCCTSGIGLASAPSRRDGERRLHAQTAAGRLVPRTCEKAHIAAEQQDVDELERYLEMVQTEAVTSAYHG